RSLPMLENLLRSDPDPVMIEPLVLAVGTLGGQRSSALLLKALEVANDHAVQHMIIEGIGRLRDRSFVDVFLKALGEPKSSQHDRAHAAMTLGRLASRSTPSPLRDVVSHRNYLIPSPTMNVIFTRL